MTANMKKLLAPKSGESIAASAMSRLSVSFGPYRATHPPGRFWQHYVIYPQTEIHHEQHTER